MRRRSEDAQYDLSSGAYEVVVPNDNADLPFVTRRIEIAAAGTLSVITDEGVQVDLPSFPAGHIFHIRAKRVRAAGTTVAAGSVIAVF